MGPTWQRQHLAQGLHRFTYSKTVEYGRSSNNYTGLSAVPQMVKNAGRAIYRAEISTSNSSMNSKKLRKRKRKRRMKRGRSLPEKQICAISSQRTLVASSPV
jgi:hypothetical protein